jgi:hypothetical protein
MDVSSMLTSFAIMMRLLAQIIEPLPKSLNLKGDSKRIRTPI